MIVPFPPSPGSYENAIALCLLDIVADMIGRDVNVVQFIEGRIGKISTKGETNQFASHVAAIWSHCNHYVVLSTRDILAVLLVTNGVDLFRMQIIQSSGLCFFFFLPYFRIQYSCDPRYKKQPKSMICSA